MEIPPIKQLLDFSDKTVLITGAGSGVGRGIALRFGEAGANVFVHYHSSVEAAVSAVDEITGGGAQAAAIAGDLTQEADVASVFEAVVKEFGGLDVLVNNSGIYPLASVLEMTPEEWDQVMSINLRSAHLCTQAAARYWVDEGRAGAIVNISSIEGENPAPNHSHYNASKGGLEMYTRSTAFELGRYGIRVNSVAPGLIWKEGIEAEWPDGVARWQKTAPLQRLGHPSDVADACLFLASSGARWITGASLRVDGGVMTHQIF